jgi:hypothetical protein
MFRHQSEEVIKKARVDYKTTSRPVSQVRKRHAPAGRRISVQKLSTHLVPNAGTHKLVQREMIPGSRQAPRLQFLQNLAQPVTAQATGFFLSSYVLGSHFEYLPALYNDTTMDHHLFSSVHAVALASFSIQFNSPGTLKEARRQYVSALHATNAALRSPQEVQKDSTLLAVLLLSLFETITCTYKSQSNVESWTDHINGATMLIRLRGRQQMTSLLGIQIFVQVTNNIIVSCVQREIPVPADVIALRAYATGFVKDSDPAWRLADMSIRVASFRAAVHDGIFDSETLIKSARQLDDDWVSWSTTMPPQWQYETFYTNDNHPLVYEGYYHRYADNRHTQIWNVLRMSRIFLNQAICDEAAVHISSALASRLLLHYATVFQRSTQILVDMCSEICASVPQHMKSLLQSPTRRSESPPLLATRSSTVSPTLSAIELRPLPSSTFPSISSALQCEDQPPRQVSETLDVAGSYFLLWPLVLAGTLAISAGPRRLWIAKSLRLIGTSMRIAPAMMAADSLEREDKVNDWYVYPEAAETSTL